MRFVHECHVSSLTHLTRGSFLSRHIASQLMVARLLRFPGFMSLFATYAISRTPLANPAVAPCLSYPNQIKYFNMN